MLEKLNAIGYESLSTPSPDVLEVLKRLLAYKKDISIAEIGVGIGATTLEILTLLGGYGELHLFDFVDRINELTKDLERNDAIKGVTVVGHTNTRLTYDSYAWTLATMALSAKRTGNLKLFDLVYLDGAHTFHHDAPATVLIKEMIRPGGYIVFDDMYWSFNKSPRENPVKKPQLRNHFSDEQLETPHIELCVKLFMESDSRFQQIYLSDNRRPYRPVFQLIQ